MSLLFMDGFDHIAASDLTKKWTAWGGVGSIRTGRRGGGCFGHSSLNNSANVTKGFAATASWVIGFAFKYSGALTGVASIAALLDAGTVQCDLRLNTDGSLSVTRNGTALTNGTSAAGIITQDTWHYIEWKVTIADSIGASTCVVRLNGAAVITVATGQDTKNTANASANSVRIGMGGTAGGNSLDIDDVYICDQAGSTNNDFLGDCRIDTLYPTSDGNYTQFTPSTGTDHYALVDETTPNTSDHNDGAAVGDRDSYGMGNLAALVSQTVYGVQVNAAILKDDAGARSASTFVRSSGTNGDGAGVALSTSQAYVSQVYETNPNGSVAWTEATVNAMEAGVRVTA